MDTPPDLTGFAHALGRAQAAWRFAGGELRRAAALATISAAWDIFRRDAGAGEFGPAHNATTAAAQLMFTEDPRRDAVLLWLADYGVPAVAEAAKAIARMVAAKRRFDSEEHALLDAARDALTPPIIAPVPIGRLIARNIGPDNSAAEPLRNLAESVDRLRCHAGFVESEGAEVRYALPRGTLSRYVSAAPAGCWAFNLALLERGSPANGELPPPGQVSRVLFRRNLDPDVLAVQLVNDASTAWANVYDRLERLERELARGRDALAHLSRNARARDAWLLVAALGACTRAQLGRALGLSRAGADIQAHALADAGLVVLASGGHIAWTRSRGRAEVTPDVLDQGPLGDAMSDVDASLAEIDRLLTGTSP